MNASTNASKKRIFLVDDHPLVREWLTNLINQQPDLMVCGESENAPQAMQAIANSKPHVAVIDLSLKNSSGLDLIKNLKQCHPEVTILILSMHDESSHAERALRAGARGYVMKRETTKKVIDAIHRILEGKLYVSDTIAEKITSQWVEGKPTSSHSPIQQLSDRELEVFELLGHGKSTREIADNLRISQKTVQAYCARIKEKLNLGGINELLREAIHWNETRHLR